MGTVMFDAIKKDNARYALFALKMLTAESREAAEVETWHQVKYTSPTADTNAATVAPRKAR
jgi:hypothetical protein